MHIAFISRLSGHGGVAVYHRTMASALTQEGHTVSLISANFSINDSKDNFSNKHHVNIKFPDLRPLYYVPGLRWYLRSLQLAYYSHLVSMRITELSSQPDIIEFADVGGEAYFYLKRQHHIPTVVRCHTPTFVLRQYYLSNEMPYDTSITARMEKFSIEKADGVTAPSMNMAKVIANTCKVPLSAINFIPNALDTSVYSSNIEKLPDDGVIFLHIGRMERVKGIQILLDAIPSVLKVIPNAKFIFVGADRKGADGQSWYKRLEEQTGKANLEERIQLVGFVDQKELSSFYQKADVAVIPSLNYESFSYTCAQAMAAGLPVVASRIGGIPETVEDGVCGILVEPGDSGQLADALIMLGKDGNLRKKFGEAGRLKACNEFDSHVVASKTVNYYSSVISKR